MKADYVAFRVNVHIQTAVDRVTDRLKRENPIKTFVTFVFFVTFVVQNN